MIQKSRFRGLAAAIALALFASACGTSTSLPDEEVATAAVRAPTSIPPDTAGPPIPQKDVDEGDAAPPSIDGEPLALNGESIDAGTYVTDLLGTRVGLTLGEGWVGRFGDPGALLIDRADKRTPVSEALIATRMSSFGRSNDITSEPKGPALAGPSNDLDAWLEAGEFIVTNDAVIDVSGVAVRQLDLVLDPDGAGSIPGGCGPTPDDRCFFVGGTYSESLAFFIVRTGEEYRLWYVDQGAEDPVLFVGIASAGNGAHLDLVGEVVRTMEFGEVQPHPVNLDGNLWELGRPSMIPSGEASVPALGGITFSLIRERFATQDQNFLGLAVGDSDDGTPPTSQAFFSQIHYTPDLEALGTVEELVEILGSHLQLSEADDRTFLGLEFKGYTMAVGDPDKTPSFGLTPARLGEESNFRFLPGPFGTVYLAAGETGVYVIGFDAPTEAGLPEAEALFNQIVPTMKFAGAGTPKTGAVVGAGPR